MHTIRTFIAVFIKKISIALALILLASATLLPQKAPNFAADMILGNWMDENNEVLVSIYKVNNKYCGKTLWIQIGRAHV